jgi:hypothetical protein
MPDGGKPSALVEAIRGRLSGRSDFINLLWTFSSSRLALTCCVGTRGPLSRGSRADSA